MSVIGGRRGCRLRAYKLLVVCIGWKNGGRGPGYERGGHSGGWIGDAESVGRGAGIGERADVGSEDVRRGGGRFLQCWRGEKCMPFEFSRSNIQVFRARNLSFFRLSEIGHRDWRGRPASQLSKASLWSARFYYSARAMVFNTVLIVVEPIGATRQTQSFSC